VTRGRPRSKLISYGVEGRFLAGFLKRSGAWGVWYSLDGGGGGAWVHGFPSVQGSTMCMAGSRRESLQGVMGTGKDRQQQNLLGAGGGRRWGMAAERYKFEKRATAE